MPPRFFLILIATLLAAEVQAAPAARVEGMQMPAWIEYQGGREPLKPFASLQPGARVLTGDGGRVLLRLAEGSQVKLGENADFTLDTLDAPKAEGGLFRGALRVLRGAFRFTTTLISQRHRRELSVQVATITAGIRGTDIWGKSSGEKDLVCLIEGEISVRKGDEAPVTMSDPLTFFVAPKDGRPPLPVAPVSEDQLRQWATETELTAGEGILGPDGQWAVGLQSFRRRASALSAQGALREAGYDAGVQEVSVGGRDWYRVAVTGFLSRSEASAFALRMQQRPGLAGAWAYPR